MKWIIAEDVVLSRTLGGPLSAHIAHWAKWVRNEGYASYSRHQILTIALAFLNNL